MVCPTANFERGYEQSINYLQGMHFRQGSELINRIRMPNNLTSKLED